MEALFGREVVSTTAIISPKAMLIDVAIILFYLGLILYVGLSKGLVERNLDDFALGGRSIPWWAVLSSIIAAETTAATFLGTPGEGYALKNFTYLQMAFGTVFGRLIVGQLFIRPYYHYKVYSIYEFLAIRFGPRSKTVASAVFLCTRLLSSGTRLYVAAILVVLACRLAFPSLGTSSELGIYVIGIVIVTLLTAIYTAIGGIKAVIWTDLIQALLMIGSALATLAFLWNQLPAGFGSLFSGASDLHFLDTGIDGSKSLFQNIKYIFATDYTIWAGVIAGTVSTMATHGTDQDMVQRMLTAKNVTESRKSLWLSGVADIPIVLGFLGIGILLWAFFQTHPDPNLPGKSNEVFGYYILTRLPAGARGLMIAGLLATAMGSLSSALNALATSFVRDWYQSLIRPSASERQILRVARTATFVFGFLMIVVASATAGIVILHPESRIIPIVLGVFGYTYGSLLGIFLVGVLTRTRGSEAGNLIAMACGFVAVAGLSWLALIAFPWRILVGTVVTFLVAASFNGARAKR